MTTMEATSSRVADDAALLAQVANGDDRAFAAIYDAHRVRLYRLAYGVLLDPSEARDAVQEAFLKLHQAAPSWEPQATVGTWLYRVVLNHCLGLKQRFVRFASAIVAPTPVASTTPEKDVAHKEAVRVVERTLADLGIRPRAVACLHLEAELTPAEIAPLVGMTPNATRVALHRALGQIREALAAAGIEEPS